LKNFFSAMAFLTVIRLPGTKNTTHADSILFFPIIGLFIGGLLVGVDYVGSLIFSNELRALIDVLFLATITGGLHLDGLADSADGFFSHKNKTRILEIMRDSRMGPMGGLALIFCLLFKTAGIESIEYSIAWPLLLVAPSISRFALVTGLVLMHNARGPESLGANFYQKGNYKFMVTGFVPAAILILWNPQSAVSVLSIALITIFMVLTYFNKRIGGVTGDTLGALSEITETIIFIAGGIVCRHWL